MSTTGDVKGNGYWGVYTLNNATSAATTVNVATATGLFDVIHAEHNGTGDLKITAAGLLTGTAESGIEACQQLRQQNGYQGSLTLKRAVTVCILTLVRLLLAPASPLATSPLARMVSALLTAVRQVIFCDHR